MTLADDDERTPAPISLPACAAVGLVWSLGLFAFSLVGDDRREATTLGVRVVLFLVAGQAVTVCLFWVLRTWAVWAERRRKARGSEGRGPFV